MHPESYPTFETGYAKFVLPSEILEQTKPHKEIFTLKTKLFTQNPCFALLMSLVLAFGVQGIAEAVSRPGTQTVAHLNTDDSTVYNVDGTPGTAPAIPTTFDDPGRKETVRITKSPGIAITNFGGLSSVTLTENDDSSALTYTREGRTFAAPATVVIRFTAKGKQWVKISGTDYNDPDDTADFFGAWSTTTTYYVKGSGSKTTTVSLQGLSAGYKKGIFSGAEIKVHNGDSGHYNVDYSTVPSGGALQIETPAGTLATATNGSSVFDVWLTMSRSYQVTARVTDSEVTTTGAYIIGAPKLTVGYPDDPNGIGTGTIADNSGAKTDPGLINDTLNNAFVARVTDQNTTASVEASSGTTNSAPGVVVKFQVKGSGTAGGYLVFDSVGTVGGRTVNSGTLVTSAYRERLNANGAQLTTATDKILYVRTDENGRATVDFQLGTDRKQDVTISAVGQSKVVSAYTGTAGSGNQLVEPKSLSSQASGHAGEYELRVKAVDEDGTALSGETVQFRTSEGTLDDPSTAATPTTLGLLEVMTDGNGVAFVFFDPNDSSSSPRVTAHLLRYVDENASPTPNDRTDDTIYVTDDVIFNIGGTSNGGGGSPQPPTQQEARLRITPSGTGTTREILVDALTAAGTLVPGRLVTLSGTAVTGSPTLTTGTAETITVPTTPGIYRLTATDLGGIYASVTVVITVDPPAANGTLSIQAIGVPTNLQQTVEVTATNAAGTGVGGVSVTLRGTGFTTQTVTTRSTGSVRAIVPIPSATGTHTLTAEATGYDAGSIDLSATGQQQPTGDSLQPTPTGPAGVATSIEIDGDRQLSGTVNQALRLRAQVLDANDRGVSGVRVTFKILRPGGKGRLSQRGNGLASQAETDRNGYATASVTPLGGNLIVEAKAAKVTAPVTFIIDVNGVSDTGTDTGTREPTETPSREITPEVLLGAAQRPPMLWVDSGGIYALVGASVGKVTLSANAVMDIAVSGNKIYWTQMTGENAGTINSANLDGTNIKQLVSIKAVPRGIAVDSVAKRLYWTNSHGWIQSSNLEGRARRNVARDLSDPMGIAVSGGNVYWTQSLEGAPIERVILKEGDVERPAFWDSKSSGTSQGLAIAGGKIYWTAKTGENAGTINSVNLDGTGSKQLVSIRAVPRGIAVDSVAKRLYWTNSHGWIQSSDLEGRARRNVANGLESPGGIVVNANIKEPLAATPAKSDTPTTANRSKYDVNGDGTVDVKDSDALIVAVAAGVTDAKYDVNGDGKVDINDVVAVTANRSESAAGAPTLLGMKLNALEVDRLQEQIDLLIATNDQSPAAMRTLVYLQQLIVMARPEKTQLLANYPNPFNPETWIPYELATDTDVKITIYNAQGVVIRTLQLGQQSAGYYTDRERAAYWDGQNAFGEQVASGVYFYQLETDDMSALRKMVILK